jgi:hypothetical protein
MLSFHHSYRLSISEDQLGLGRIPYSRFWDKWASTAGYDVERLDWGMFRDSERQGMEDIASHPSTYCVRCRAHSLFS